MALFKAENNVNMDEMQAYIDIASSFNFDAVLPAIKDTERDLIEPLLGITLYDDLHEFYNAESSSGSSSETLTNAQFNDLLAKVQEPLAKVALLKHLPISNVKVTGSGLTQHHSDKEKPAFQWAVNAYEDGLRSSANLAIEALLVFLEENKDIYTDWLSSAAYTEFKEFFITTASAFNKHYNINNTRGTFLALKNVIKDVEQLMIRPAIGEDFFDQLKTAHQSANGPTGAQQTIIDKLIPAIAKYTIARGIEDLPLQWKDNGIYYDRLVGASNKQQETPTSIQMNSQLEKVARTCQAEGDAYMQQAITYLNTNASANKYTTYFNSDKYDESQPTDTPTVVGDAGSAAIF